VERREPLCEPVAVDLAALVEPDTRWMFDLIDPVSETRAIALQRNADLVERQRATVTRDNEIWVLAGRSWKPSDPGLLAAWDQVRAEVRAIRAQLPRRRRGRRVVLCLGKPEQRLTCPAPVPCIAIGPRFDS